MNAAQEREWRNTGSKKKKKKDCRTSNNEQATVQARQTNCDARLDDDFHYSGPQFCKPTSSIKAIYSDAEIKTANPRFSQPYLIRTNRSTT